MELHGKNIKEFVFLNNSLFSSLATGWSKWEEWDESYEEIKMHSSSARTMIFFGFLNSILFTILLYYAIVAYNQGFYYLYQHVQDGNFLTPSYSGTILSGFWSSDLWLFKNSSEDSTLELTCSGVHQAFGEELNEPINPQYRTVQMEDSDEDEVPNESKWNQTEVLPTPFSPNFGKKTNNEIQNIAR